MVDLGKFQGEVFKGTISEVKEISLKEHLQQRHGAKADNVIDQFVKSTRPNKGETKAQAYARKETAMDRPHVVLIIAYDSAEIDWFAIVPKAQGWNKSNLKKVMERNDLPPVTAEWVGKEIDLRVNEEGFMRVAV